MPHASIRKDLSAQYRTGTDFGMVTAVLYSVYWTYARFNEVIINASFWYGWQSLIGLLLSFAVGFAIGRQLAKWRKGFEFKSVPRTVGWVSIAVFSTAALVKGATDAEKAKMLSVMEIQRSILLQNAEDRIDQAKLTVVGLRETIASMKKQLLTADDDHKKQLTSQIALAEQAISQKNKEIAVAQKDVKDWESTVKKLIEQSKKQLQAFQKIQQADPTGILPPEEKGKEYDTNPNGQTSAANPTTGVLPQPPTSKGGNAEAVAALVGLVAIMAPELLPVLAPLLGVLGLALGTETVDLPAMAQTIKTWHIQGQDIDVQAEVQRLRKYRFKNPIASVRNLLTLVKTTHIQTKLGTNAAAIENELLIQLQIWQKLPAIAASIGLDETIKFISAAPTKLTLEKIDEVANHPCSVVPSRDAWLAIVARYLDLASSQQGTIKLNDLKVEAFKIDASSVPALKEALIGTKPDAKKEATQT